MKLKVKKPRIINRKGPISPFPCPVCEVPLTHLVSSRLYVCDSGQHGRQAWTVTSKTYNYEKGEYIV